MRPIERQAGERCARRDQRVAAATDGRAHLRRQGRDGARDPVERDDLVASVDSQAQRREVAPAAGQTLAAVARSTEARRGDGYAGQSGQRPASSAGSASTAAIALAVVSRAASAAPLNALAA